MEDKYGLNDHPFSSAEINIEDELIKDPFFATLLNDNREIIVGNNIYLYTELGLYFCDVKLKQNLYDYFENLTADKRLEIIRQQKNRLQNNNSQTEFIETLDDGITHYSSLYAPVDPIDEYDHSPAGGASLPSGPIPILNSTNLPVCDIQSQGFFEHWFGTSEECHDYFTDNRRTATSFWNQNFYIYASIGSEVRLQKREVLDLWIGSIVWWEKSYADKIELGVNYLTYNYNFNVPIFNQQSYNYSNTFFEFNGTKYNINGSIIPDIPTGKGNFKFNTDSNQLIMDIYVFGYNITLDNGQVNSYVDQALNQLINQVNIYDKKQELIQAKNSGNMKVNILYAVPFSNRVKIITSNVAWRANNDNSITHYFDFNFTFTWNSSYSGYGQYLQGLNGATSYTDVKVELYGAALHNNQWRGNKLIYNP